MPKWSRIRRRVEEKYFPSTCEIFVDNISVSSAGVVSRGAGRRLHYRGTSTLPCRLDRSKHYRQTEVEKQELNVSEYTLHLPKSIMEIPMNARVYVNSKWFEIQKLLDEQSWDVSVQALLTIVNRGEYNTSSIPDSALLLEDSDWGYLLAESGNRLLKD